MAKYYAVKKGHKTGIFNSWPECEAAVKGYSSPDYASFQTEEEAKAYLKEENIYLNQIKDDLSKGYVVAYTDGSYDEKSKQYAYGICIFDKAGNEIELCNKGNYESFISSRNIAGEVFGVLTALDWALSNGYEKIKIYHDQECIAKWASGEYNAESKIAKFYVTKLKERFEGYIDYDFVNVKGHSNNPYNEKADALAYSALRGERKMIKGANSFSVPNFGKTNLEKIIQLIKEDYDEVKDDRKTILGGEQIRLSIGNKNEYVIIKIYNNNNLLVQGKPNIAYQVVFAFVSELLGEEKIVHLIKQAYRLRIDPDTIDSNYNNLCPRIPDTYNSNIRTLIRQAIINLNGNFEAEEYSQYAFPALRALEGHLKYLFGKYNINIANNFDRFIKNSSGNYELRKDSCNSCILLPHRNYIEECYNYYCKTRHKIFHFGDIIGNTDNTMMIATKKEADDIIREVLTLINRTVY